MNLVRWLERVRALCFETILGRLRAQGLRFRGASIEGKTRFGTRCRVLKPWCLTVGNNVHFEDDVFVKLTQDDAVLSIGAFSFVGRGCEFDVAHSVTVGSEVLIAPGCFITDHSHKHSLGATIASQGCVGKPVTIGDDVWLGAKSVVLAGVNIGAGAVVGANSVVNCDIEANSIVAGSPARVIGWRK